MLMFFLDFVMIHAVCGRKKPCIIEKQKKVFTPKKEKLIYMDYQATTPCDPRVTKKIIPYFTKIFGNPHSQHPFGWVADQAVREARKNVAKLLNGDPENIIFTCGATEANNLALKGVAHWYKKNKNKKHIITVKTEHKCILNSCKFLESEGFSVTYLDVDKNGLINLDELENAINDSTIMVSIMAVNNEIGVIQDLESIGKICKKHNILFHTDAAQAVGKIPIDVQKLHINLLSLSGHKLYGPKGIGALYVDSQVQLEPQVSGGGQEKNIRSGTQPTPLCIGLGEACKIAKSEMKQEQKQTKKLAQYLYNELKRKVPDITLNGHPTKRVAGNVNLCFHHVKGPELLEALNKKIAISSGSACSSGDKKPSYVLKALGLNDDEAQASLRFGIGRFTKKQDIDATVDYIAQTAQKFKTN